MTTTYPVSRWKVGAVAITRVVEIEGPSPGTIRPRRHGMAFSARIQCGVAPEDALPMSGA